MSPKPPSQYPAHRTAPTLARRAMPVMALGSLAGVLVFALDRPASRASADGQSADAVAVDDTGDGSGITIADTGDGSSLDSTVPDAPQRRETALDTGSSDTTDETTADTPQDTESASSTKSSTKSTTKSTTAATTKATTAATTRTTTKTTTSSSSCKSYKGPTVSTRWGPVQVKASVSSSGKICSVSVLQHPTGRRSDSINANAIPTLNSRAMAAQSASFNSVSGATVTSRGYKQSLQAILDAAHG